MRAGGAYRGGQVLAFLPRVPSLLRSQGLGFSLTGLALQFADALVFVFLVRYLQSPLFVLLYVSFLPVPVLIYCLFASVQLAI